MPHGQRRILEHHLIDALPRPMHLDQHARSGRGGMQRLDFRRGDVFPLFQQARGGRVQGENRRLARASLQDPRTGIVGCGNGKQRVRRSRNLFRRHEQEVLVVEDRRLVVLRQVEIHGADRRDPSLRAGRGKGERRSLIAGEIDDEDIEVPHGGGIQRSDEESPSFTIRSDELRRKQRGDELFDGAVTADGDDCRGRQSDRRHEHEREIARANPDRIVVRADVRTAVVRI